MISAGVANIHRQQMNPRQQPRIGTAERTGIEQETEQHDVHGEESADAEADQQPGGLPLLALPVLHLKGDAAAVAAERAILAAHLALHRAQAKRQETMAAQMPPRSLIRKVLSPRHVRHGRRRAGLPRPSVIKPSSRMKLPASHTPRCRHAGASTWPTPPIISMAGKGSQSERHHGEQARQRPGGARRLSNEGIDQRDTAGSR